MYLTAGQFKGTKIDVPVGVKPTLSKVRESVFNMAFGFDLEDKTFLDMFSGSGIMGLEALSRGYKARGLEISPKNISVIKKNYSKIKCNMDIVTGDCLKYETDEKFSIVYIDPPWQDDYIPIIKKALEFLNDKGVIFVEHDKIRNIDIKKLIEANNIPLEVFKSKKYGRCLVDVLIQR